MELAAARGVTVLAVTDHDTLDGVAEAQAAGAALGVRVVPGVELSARAPSGSMHLLGYFAEAAPRPLLDHLAELRERREARARRIARRLADLGAPIDMDLVRSRARGPIGRPHLADALVAAGHAADRRDAFDRFLGDGLPAAVPHDALAPERAIALVRESGGVCALAHPGTLRLPASRLGGVVRRLAAAGLAGIEVHRPEHTAEQREAYATLADRNGLVRTGGSDFHDPGGPLAPGDTGVPALPDDAVDRLLARRAGGPIG